MTGYPAALDRRYGAELRAQRRKVARLQQRTAGIDSGAPLAVLPGVIDPDYSGSGNPRCAISGASELTGPYQYLASYSPSPGDAVLVVPTPVTASGVTSYIILGALPGEGGATGGTLLVEGGDATGATSSSTAIQDALDEAGGLGTGGGAVKLPPGKFFAGTPLIPVPGVRLTADSRAGTKLFSTGTPLFDMGPAGTLLSIEVDHLFLSATAAPVFSGANIERSDFHHCQFQQLSGTDAIWDSTAGPGLMIEVTFRHNIETVAGGTRTVPAWNLVATSNSYQVNACSWEHERTFNNGGDAAMPWYSITSSGSGVICDGNFWDDITFENQLGGLFQLLSVRGSVISRARAYDPVAAYAGHLITIAKNGSAGSPVDNAILYSGRVTGSLGSGVYDLDCDANCTGTYLAQPRGSGLSLNFGGSTGVTATDLPAGYTLTGVGGVGDILGNPVT